jgi:hypothetical protein
MPKEDWQNNTVEKIFQREGLYPTGKIKTVLDVGCGLSLKSQYIDAVIRVGLEIYPTYLEKIETDVPYVGIVGNALDLDKLFLPKSFDLVLLLDILEHVEKSDGLLLLEMAERIARVAVIIETPKGYIPQNLDIWGWGGHEFQTHRCGWEVEEFTARGYNTILRPYTMCDVRRHTELDVPSDIVFIDAIKRLDS